MAEKRNLYIAGAIAAVIVVAAAAYFLLLQPQYGGEAEAPAAEERPSPAEAEEAELITGGEVRMVLREWSIEPSTLRIKAGSTVTFVVVNEGSFPHALTIERQDIGFKASTSVFGGGGQDTLTVTFEEPGEYVIYCPVGDHRQRGMEGVIIVVEG